MQIEEWFKIIMMGWGKGKECVAQLSHQNQKAETENIHKEMPVKGAFLKLVAEDQGRNKRH